MPDSPFSTLWRIFASVFPPKGGYPHKRMYMITPELQMSADLS